MGKYYGQNCDRGICPHNISGVCRDANYGERDCKERICTTGLTRVTIDAVWIVWCLNGGSPTVMHKTEKEALTEAARLAAKHPGKEFVIFKSETSVRTEKPQIEFIPHRL